MHEPSCFVALPRGLSHTLHDQQAELPLALELTPTRDDTAGRPGLWGFGGGAAAAAAAEVEGTGLLLVGWGGAAAAGNALEVPAALAECHGLRDGDVVTMRPVRSLPVATMVEVEPASTDQVGEATAQRHSFCARTQPLH